ncbi:OmpA/MotB family protein [Magnetococcales bacterium HHB-1]
MTESPFWISYADLMTALVMLFLVVMSISMVAMASRSLVEQKRKEDGISEVMAQLDQGARKKGLDIAINRGNHTISFGSKVRFDKNSHALTPEGIDKLQRFVPLLLGVKSSDSGKRWLKRVHVEGYTDTSGSYLYNVYLSLNRAHAVVCALMATKLPKPQIDQLRSMLIIDGASTTTIKDSPEESRRVEIRLEFRETSDETTIPIVPEMPLGHCVLSLNEEQ